MSVLCNLIQELMFYEFELGPKAAKSICCEKGEGTVDHSTVNFGWSCKNLNDRTRSGKLKTVDSKVVFQGKSGKYHSESIRRTWHLIVQCGFSLSQPVFVASGLKRWFSRWCIEKRSDSTLIHEKIRTSILLVWFVLQYHSVEISCPIRVLAARYKEKYSSVVIEFFKRFPGLGIYGMEQDA